MLESPLRCIGWKNSFKTSVKGTPAVAGRLRHYCLFRALHLPKKSARSRSLRASAALDLAPPYPQRPLLPVSFRYVAKPNFKWPTVKRLARRGSADRHPLSLFLFSGDLKPLVRGDRRGSSGAGQKLVRSSDGGHNVWCVPSRFNLHRLSNL
jgi:hypothetical protein